MNRAGDDRLLTCLTRARELGFLGPGDPRAHLAHAYGFVAAAEAELGHRPASFADLGTGGGVPGLVLASVWTDTVGIFVEASGRRVASLRKSLDLLGATPRVQVLEGRGEEWAHDPAHRERYELVTARSFAAPAPTAEIATGFVRAGGILVVSEPPVANEGRWAPDPLHALGFGPAAPRAEAEGSFAVFAKIAPAPVDRPRPTGKPAKRPLWDASRER